MESNTPTPYQRNRRAGRVSALPSELPLNIPPEYQGGHAETAPTASPLSAPVAPQTSQAAPAPYAAAAPYPQASRPAYQTASQQRDPQPVHPQAAVPVPRSLQQAHAQRMPATNAPVWSQPNPENGRSAQPAARAYAPAGAQPVPSQRAASPAPRPRAAGTADSMYRDDPQLRRKAAQPRSAAAQAAEPEVDVTPRKAPSWMWTVFSVMLIGVMALFAFGMLMQAWLKTNEDEKVQAWQKTLNNYHVSEQPDGTLRVTWQDLIERYAREYNLDPAFVTAIIRNESSFRTEAESSVGARGLMQMMPDTAEWIAGKLGESYDFDLLYTPEVSIRYGCWYLGYLSDLFAGDPVLVCAAYHAGQGEVWGWLGESDVSPDGVSVPISNIPISQTKQYAERVTTAYGIYRALLYP